MTKDETDEELARHILDAAEDAGRDFAYDDRKEDEEFSGDALKRALEAGLVTMEEISSAFIQGMSQEGL